MHHTGRAGGLMLGVTAHKQLPVAQSLLHIAAKVTIGVYSVLMSGAEVGENSVLTAGSVVPPNTHTPANELWGGIPAKRIKAL